MNEIVEASQIPEIIKSLRSSLQKENGGLWVFAYLGQSPFRDALPESETARAFASSRPNEELIKVLDTVLTKIQETPIQSWNIKEAPLVPVEDESTRQIIQDHVRELEKAQKITTKTIETARASRRERIRGRIAGYIKESVMQARLEASVDGITNAVVDALEKNPDAPIDNLVRNAIPNASPELIHKIATDKRLLNVQRVYQKSLEESIAGPVLSSPVPLKTAEVVDAVITNIPPEADLNNFLFLTDADNLKSITDPIAKAVVTSDILSVMPEEKRGALISSVTNNLSQTLTTGPVAKAALDILNAVGGPGLVNDVIEKSFAKQAKEIKTAAHPHVYVEAAKALGEIARAQQAQSQKPAYIPNFIYRGMVSASASALQKPLAKAFQTTTWVIVLRGQQVVTWEVLPILMASGRSTWKTILGWGEEVAVKKGVDVVTTEVGLGKTILKLFSPLGTAATVVLGFVGDKLVQPILSFIGGAFSLFSGSFINGIIGWSNRPPAKYEWLRDLPLVLAFFIVAFIIAPIIVPNFLPALGFSNALFQKQGRDKWQIVMLSQSEKSEGGEGEALDLKSNPQARAQKKLGRANVGIYSIAYSCDPTTDPSCAVPSCAPDPANPDKCAWPVECGTISQGPGQTGGSHAENNLNAIDILTGGCGGHMAVTSLTSGEVSYILDYLPEGSDDPINGGYGNRVVIKSTDKNGNVFYVMYGHLLYIAQNNTTGNVLKVGDKINIGDPIGKTNDNGVSYGDHLHLEIRGSTGNIGGPSINTILPQAVPAGCYNAGGKPCGATIGG